MNNKEKQALNEKIAKWIGFKSYLLFEQTHWQKPNGDDTHLPNFCDSMDAHAKWSIPHLTSLGWLTRVQYGQHTFENAWGDSELLRKDGKPNAYAQIYFTRPNIGFTQRNYYAIADEMAEALSLTIEKLIDSKEK